MISKEYIKHNIIMAVLRKANSHSVAICRLIKETIMYQGEKLIQALIFIKLPSADEALTRRNIIWYISYNSF